MVSGKHIIRRLEQAGWIQKSQVGSQAKLVKAGFEHHIVIPHPTHEGSLDVMRDAECKAV
jgi:predicted RNA binding protein YcfA (HicA-like mRNA interferase family)